MAANDSAAQAGNDNLATNVLATVNGTAVSGLEAQRIKVGFGDDGDYRDASAAHPLPVRWVSSTSTVTTVAASTSSVVVIAANSNRRRLLLHATTGSATCYVRLQAAAATAAAGGHSFEIPPGGLWEDNSYTGEVRAIWSAATGALNVTEGT